MFRFLVILCILAGAINIQEVKGNLKIGHIDRILILICIPIINSLQILDDLPIDSFLSLIFLTGGCVEYGIDYTGYDVDKKYDIKSWQQCANICHGHKTCQYWSWRMEWKYCFLKSSMNGRQQRGDRISGKENCLTEC